jgi:Tfp pilus assembly protein PilF
MIRNAENQLKKRQPQLAFSTLEQALYIDGQDPLVWHLMARAQLDQGNVVQAVSLAQKSNSLAAAYPDVKKKNAALLRQAQGWAD